MTLCSRCWLAWCMLSCSIAFVCICGSRAALQTGHEDAGIHRACNGVQVVLAPHVYGPAVTHAATAWAGPELFARLSNSFGWATRPGVHGTVN